jgi:uncharacterized protein YbaR (Trm112 family)
MDTLKTSEFPPKIYCDLDQVLVAFLAGARKALGKEFNDPALGTDQEKWVLIEQIQGFWENLEWMPNAQTLWDRIKHRGPHVLSAMPPKEQAPSCPGGKRIWCRENLAIPDAHVNLVSRIEKQKYAVVDGIQNLLIDDHPKNVLEWTAAGGIAIMHSTVPETLNALDHLKV